MKRAFCFILAFVMLSGASVSCFGDAALTPASIPGTAPEAPSPSPYFPENGAVLVAPDYKGIGEIKVIADEDTDYYVYLEYVGEPGFSSTARELAEGAEVPYESDLAFYVKAGQWVKQKVPVGAYKLYYAAGTGLFEENDLFGDETKCYLADSLLEFYTDENHYSVLWTLEFYKLSAYDYRTAIPREDFPQAA